MAITFRQAVGASDRSVLTSFTMSKPTGTVKDDIMICNMFIFKVDAITATAPDGWTLLESFYLEYATRFLYYKVAGSSEPSSYQWTFSSTVDGSSGMIVSYSGVNTSNPINDSSGYNDNGWNKSLVGGSVDIANTNSKVLFFPIDSNPKNTITNPSGWTTVFTYAVDGNWPRAGISLIISEKDYSSGSTGDITFTLSLTSSQKNAFGVTLNPAASLNTSNFFQLF